MNPRVVIGLAATLATSRVIRNQLFGVDVLDAPTLSAVVLILLTSVAAAPRLTCGLWGQILLFNIPRGVHDSVSGTHS